MNRALVFLTVFSFIATATPVTTLAHQCEAAPQLIVSDARWQIHKGIQLKWRISNDSDAAIFVYATFLSGRRAAAWTKRSDGVFELRTSLPTKLNMTAYSYPQAIFKEIGPHSVLEGYFSDPAERLKGRTKARITFSVAYGNSIETVQKRLEDSPHLEAEHPANPIVEWQCVAWSQVLELKRFH